MTSDTAIEPLAANYSGVNANDVGTMANVLKITGALDMWKEGYTGKGIDIALIDTGVAPVDGLTTPARS